MARYTRERPKPCTVTRSPNHAVLTKEEPSAARPARRVQPATVGVAGVQSEGKGSIAPRFPAAPTDCYGLAGRSHSLCLDLCLIQLQTALLGYTWLHRVCGMIRKTAKSLGFQASV